MTFNTFSQIEDPVQWYFSVEQISDTTCNLVIEAEIENGWNVYSQHVDPDGPVPTSFSFFQSKDFELIDSVKESNPTTKFDPVFEMNLSSFQNTAIFQQKIHVLNDIGFFIKGELEFMVCNATMCLPPDYVDMSFAIKKKNNVTNSIEKEVLQPQNSSYKIPSIDLNNPIGNCGEKKGEKSLWGIFLLGIIGGFIALLTPCVFPMIPLTVSFFTKGSEQKSKLFIMLYFMAYLYLQHILC